ncbi:hypothetical protein F441_15277 [Phytophthora nicotianae CJ01A1]|uniref:DUF6818 domain-containing protein n=1 Tax=Phytophthora nicotianae CJ01A1 TaxID=1317063 RepID=W2WEB4_PHYNI|nr:hypothetical protein F441_15277 [Phytophthora nicotianae CJ01A1]
MSRRGRRSGYKNFSVPEQMLHCNVLDEIRPLGKDMWERVATKYNSCRPRGTLERDYDSLRRKFRSLVAKNKPSGINGEIPESQKPIALTQEIHVHIEAKASVFENFDGNDGGEDDDALVKHVKSLSNSVDTGNVKPDAQNSLRRSSTQTPQPRASFLPANHDLSVRVEENQEVRSSTDEQLATTHSPGTDPHRLIDNVGIGSISTSEDNGEEATLREEDREVEVEATAIEQGKSQESTTSRRPVQQTINSQA